MPNATAQALKDRLDAPAEHNHADVPGLVDGAKHPELIPDKVAYRLYFVAVSEMPNPSGQQKLRQAAHLKATGIKDEHDRQSFVDVLTDFKVRYNALIAAYNQAAEAADEAGTAPDFAGFIRKRDELVQSTRGKLTTSMSAESLARLDARVQIEKRNMKVSVGEVQ